MTRFLTSRDESNSGLRVIAVLMAIALWLFVGPWQRIETGVRKISLPIELKHAPEDQRPKVDPPTVEVIIEGPRKAIEHLEETQLEAYIDMRSRNRLRFPVHVSVPPGVRYQVTPSEVRIVAPK